MVLRWLSVLCKGVLNFSGSFKSTGNDIDHDWTHCIDFFVTFTVELVPDFDLFGRCRIPM